jgi:hypothetical protein
MNKLRTIIEHMKEGEPSSWATHDWIRVGKATAELANVFVLPNEVASVTLLAQSNVLAAFSKWGRAHRSDRQIRYTPSHMTRTGSFTGRSSIVLTFHRFSL